MNLINKFKLIVEDKLSLLFHTKPVYTKEFIAFSDFDKFAINKLLRKINRNNLTVLEVGSWMGNGSTRAIVNYIRNKGGILYCVDTWKGNPNVLKHINISKNYDVYNSFLYNVRKYGGEELVKPMVMSSEDASKIIKDKSIDLIFIDADHSYEQVKKDISMWKSKVASGGILCGHDCEIRASELDIDILISNKNSDTIDGTKEFPKIHPGTILAIHELLGEKVNLSSESLITLKDGTKGRSSIWYYHC